jgi:hypothetical protein
MKRRGGGKVMRRKKRSIIVRVALGLAIAGIIPITAQAKPTPYEPDVQSSGQYELGPGEIPYLSQNREGYPAWAKQIETPYWFSTPTTTGITPDDRSVSRQTGVGSTPVVVSDDGRSIDFNAYTVTGSVVALLLAIGGGMVFGVWYSRKTTLSPA